MAAKKSGSGKTPPKGPGYSTSTKGNNVQVTGRSNTNRQAVKPSKDDTNYSTTKGGKKGVTRTTASTSRAGSVAMSNKLSGRNVKSSGKK